MTTTFPVEAVDCSYERTMVLGGGLQVLLRAIRPTDETLLRDGFARLSMGSRVMRFFAPLHMLSDTAVHYLTDVDGKNHVAIVAVSPPSDGDNARGFGVARFIRSAKDPATAELAITVTDDAQGRGLGRRLLEMLTYAARRSGIATYEMSVHWGNARVHSFLERLGATRRRRDGEIVEYTIDTALLAPVFPKCAKDNSFS
jgi:GNAT superfamily N-acetyltransferase